jgi:hypothetical protein
MDVDSPNLPTIISKSFNFFISSPPASIIQTKQLTTIPAASFSYNISQHRYNNITTATGKSKQNHPNITLLWFSCQWSLFYKGQDTPQIRTWWLNLQILLKNLPINQLKVCYSDIIQICGENCLTNPPPQLSKYKPNIKVNNRDTVKLDAIHL